MFPFRWLQWSAWPQVSLRHNPPLWKLMLDDSCSLQELPPRAKLVLHNYQKKTQHHFSPHSAQVLCLHSAKDKYHFTIIIIIFHSLFLLCSSLHIHVFTLTRNTPLCDFPSPLLPKISYLALFSMFKYAKNPKKENNGQ